MKKTLRITPTKANCPISAFDSEVDYEMAEDGMVVLKNMTLPTKTQQEIRICDRVQALNTKKWLEDRVVEHLEGDKSDFIEEM